MRGSRRQARHPRRIDEPGGHLVDASIGQGARRWTAALVLGASAVLAGCGGSTATTALDGELLVQGTPSVIRTESMGGIAALHEVAEIDSASGQVSWRIGGLCAQPTCPASDCATGLLDAATVAELFGRTTTLPFRQLRRDYGHSTQGADLMGYRIVIRANGRERTIAGDDITLPPLASRFSTDVKLAVLRAVGR